MRSWWWSSFLSLGFATFLSINNNNNERQASLVTVEAAPATTTRRRTAKATTQPQNPYLKEILMGRCYENPLPPSTDGGGAGGAQLCPVIVPTFLGVLEGQLDDNIDPDSYYMYLGWTNKYDVPKDSAVFVWPPPTSPTTSSVLVDASERTAAAAETTWILPETTPSGSLMNGLIFCGIDRRMDCPTEFWKEDDEEKGTTSTSTGGGGAMLSFWRAIYSDFTSKAQGQVTMLILSSSSSTTTPGSATMVPGLWNQSVLPNLDSDRITKVDIITTTATTPTKCEDDPTISALIEVIQSKNIECSCRFPNKQPPPPPPEEEASPSSACAISDLLQSTTSSHDGEIPPPTTNDDNNNKLITSPPGPPSPPSPKRPEQQQCPSRVYEYLFWSIIVVGAAAAYTLWSVRHYLPQYERVPNVENGFDENGVITPLPKQ